MEIFNILREQHDKALDVTKSLTYNRESGKHRVAMWLYLTVLENGGACIRLMELQYRSAVGVLLRNILEAFIDLKNLEKNDNYLDQMYANNKAEDIKLLKNAKENRNNPYFASVWEKYQSIEDIEKAIEDLDGKNKISIKDKFDSAGLSDEYVSVYNILCRSSHNNLSSLIDRFYSNDNLDEAFKQLSIFDFNEYCSTISGLLVDSLISLYIILERNEDEDLGCITDYANRIKELAIKKEST